jgi:hypothetical protein
MTREGWAKIKESADLLGLGEKASLAEIKKAYRHLSKKHHPDVQNSSKQKSEKVKMHKLTEAYQTLLHYCSEYHFPLIPGDNEHLEGEDWWLERFGQDPLWGRGSAPKEDGEK